MTSQLWFLTYLCLFSGLTQAQPYTLEMCLESALQNNLQIRASEQETKQVHRQVAEVRSGLLPQVGGEYNYTYNPNIPPTFLPGFIVGQPQEENVAAVLGLKQMQHVGLTASQQLFNPEILSALQAVKTASKLSDLQLSRTREDVFYQVSSTYYSLLSLYKSIELLEANIKSFETTIQTAQTLERNDLAKKSDVSRLLLAKQSLETQLIQLSVTEANALNVLRLLTNTPTDAPFAIERTIETETTPIAYIDSIAVERTDYKLLQTTIALKEIERKGILTSYMPTLVLFGGYFSYAFNPSFNPVERFDDKSFAVSQIGLRLSFPIFDGGGRHAKIQQKNYELKKLRYQQQFLQDQIKNEQALAIQRHNAQIKILQKEKESVALAQTVLDEIKISYYNGFVSINEVIDAENDLLKAQTNYVTALINVQIAILDWRKASGTLLNF
ncbi:MAG: TolC family protein [Bernardetiaceae bacterium]